MIKQITNAEDLKGCFYLADQFGEISSLVKYDPETAIRTWTNLLNSGAGVLFVSIKDNKPVGILGGIKHPDLMKGTMTATETFWFVDPKYKGVGKFLLEAFENWAKEQGCERVLMMALLDSMPKRVIKIYQKLGYHPIEVTYCKEF